MSVGKRSVLFFLLNSLNIQQLFILFAASSNYNFKTKKMKKLLLWVALLGFGSGTMLAQTPAAAPAKQKTEAAKPAPAVKPTATSSTAVGLKKDGTPDKRFKKAKHVKKDGTPDKRFSEHKDNKAKTPATK